MVAGNAAVSDGVPVQCVPPAQWGNLPDGRYSFSATATDRLGNWAAPVTAHWLVDTVAPLIGNLAFPPATRNTSISVGFTVTDSGSGVNTTECRCARIESPCVSLAKKQSDLVHRPAFACLLGTFFRSDSTQLALHPLQKPW